MLNVNYIIEMTFVEYNPIVITDAISYISL
jgi:hypothetical protein